MVWPLAIRARTGTANVWASMSVDAERRLLFIPVSSPSPNFFQGAVPLEVLHQLGDVLHRVVGRRPCPKRGAANVDRIGSVLEGLDADVQVAGGR